MASKFITSNGSKGHHKFTLIVDSVHPTGYLTSNSSSVSFKFILSSLGGGYNWEQWGLYISYTVSINGTSYTGTIDNYDGNSDVTLKSGTLTVTHNDDGTKTIPISFSVKDTSSANYTCGNASASGTLALEDIPRYLSITSLYVSNITESSVVVNWSTNKQRDSTYYSLDNGSTWIGSATHGESLASGLQSGSFTILGLTEKKTYNLLVKIKRTDSQLWTISNVVTFTTYDYPHCTDSPDFTIGDKLTLTFYNPLGREIRVVGYAKSDGSQIFAGTTTGTSLTGFNTNDDNGGANAQYASIPDSQSGAYKVVVTWKDISSRTRDNGNIYRIRGDEIPTMADCTYEDVSSSVYAITGNKQLIVQNKSSMRAYFGGATANFGASGITKVDVECNGKTISITHGNASYLNFQKIDSSRNVDLKFTAYDSRGLSASKTVTVQMVAYEAPKATVELKRLNNYEDETYLTVDGSVSSVGSNAMSIKYRYKLSGGSYGSYTTISDGTKQTLSLDKNNSYIFNIVVTDSFGETFNSEYVLNKGVFPLFIDTAKNSVGINCFPVNQNSLEVNGLNLLDWYKCEKNILLTTGVGLKITINRFGGDNDKATLIVAGADNASTTPVFKVLRIKKNNSGDLTGFGELNLGLASEVKVSGNSIHIFATQWSFFTVKAPLGCEITLSNSAL